MELNIDITAKIIDSSFPVEGNWVINFGHTDSEWDVIESIKNWMDYPEGLDVSIYHLDGRAITSDIPSEGTFLCFLK